VIVAGLFYFKGHNLDPFIPTSGSKPAPGGDAGTTTLIQDIGINTGTFGIGGIFSAAAIVFFAFIGFDIVATAAEESKNPQRDMPIAIFGSLAICTTLYVAVSLVVTAMVPYSQIKLEAPLAEAFRTVGESGIAQVVSFGALAGLTTVTLILMLGQSRVFFAMSRDHLLPPLFAHVSKRYKAPYRTTILTGTAVAALTFFVDLETLAELVNIGTLFAFIVVAIGVVVLRRAQPDLKRAYRTPFVPLVPILAVLASLWLMLNLPAETWERFGIWMVFGLVVYFGYSRRHSRLN
jgi:APA family basic amino acid/polyamine antiporter